MFSPVGNAIFLVAFCYSVFALARMWKRNRDDVIRTVNVTVLALVTFLAIGFWIWNGMLAYGPDRDSINGDLWNMSSSLFAALAFVAVAISIHIQRQQNSEQRKQIDRQNFEGMFFEMLRTLSDGMDRMSIVISPGAKSTTGLSAIVDYTESIEAHYQIKLLENKKKFSGGREYNLEVLRKEMRKAYDLNSGSTGAFFRTVYTILSFIEKSQLPNKKDYAKLIRAQLPDAAATMLAQNYLSNQTTDQFNDLLERYGMLKNSDCEKKQSIRDFLCYMKPIAFGTNKVHVRLNIDYISLPERTR